MLLIPSIFKEGTLSLQRHPFTPKTLCTRGDSFSSSAQRPCCRRPDCHSSKDRYQTPVAAFLTELDIYLQILH